MSTAGAPRPAVLATDGSHLDGRGSRGTLSARWRASLPATRNFGDTRILRSARRPFKTIAEHDAHLIASWKAAVGADDEVWFLGDFAPRYDARAVGALLAELPGHKHLITGNNDDAATRTHPVWASVQDYIEIVEADRLCILCHYALRTWNKIGKGSLDLHGHSHAMLKPLPRQFDVGVDAWDYTPVTLTTMIEARRQRRAGRATG